MIKNKKPITSGPGLPAIPDEIILSPEKRKLNWKRLLFIVIGIILFTVVYYAMRPHGRTPSTLWESIFLSPSRARGR